MIERNEAEENRGGVIAGEREGPRVTGRGTSGEEGIRLSAC